MYRSFIKTCSNIRPGSYLRQKTRISSMSGCYIHIYMPGCYIRVVYAWLLYTCFIYLAVIYMFYMPGCYIHLLYAWLLYKCFICLAVIYMFCMPGCYFHIQLNLINSKFSGPKVLFLITCSLNYREVDIKIYNPQK